MDISIKPIIIKSAKALAIIGFLALYGIIILAIAKKYLVDPSVKEYPVYKYSSGKSDTEYNSTSIDAFIKEIDKFIMENEILSRIDKFISDNNPKENK